MNSTLTDYKYINKNFILFVIPIAVLTSVSLCIPIYSFTLKFYKWIKNKYFNNNLNSSLVILQSNNLDIIDSKKSFSSSSEDLPSYNDVIN